MKKESIVRKLRKILSPIRRIGLNNKDFTIISNNCWGGFIYDYFGLKYRTPTIGLYFSSDDYIKFIENLDDYLQSELIEFKDENHPNTVVGILKDIKIYFVHYSSFDVAKQKWKKRIKRINFNNILIKFNDQNDFRKEYFNDFLKLKYPNKIFFTVDKTLKDENSYFFEDKNNLGYVENDIKESLKIINIREILNEMEHN